MRVFIQIPCLNEEKTLPLVLEKMPTQIPGVDDIQLLVIDDAVLTKLSKWPAISELSILCITLSQWAWPGHSAMVWITR